jgi:hypothetical protein
MDGGSIVLSARKMGIASPALRVGRAEELETLRHLDKRTGYERFFEHIDSTRTLIHEYVSNQASHGCSILGYGAGGKGQSLLNMVALDASQIPYVIDDVPGNAGRFIPGTKIQVVTSTDDKTKDADIILLTAPTHVSEILRKEVRRAKAGTQFLVTVPGVHLIPARFE